MRQKILNENIDRLNVSCKSIQKLKENKILILKEICSKTKIYLKDIGLEEQEINSIELELQLLGLNLKTNY